MRRFTDLYLALDASTRTTAKTAALAQYFASVPAHDAAWATFFLTGRKLKRVVGTRDLVAAAIEASRVSEWLFHASYAAVGDLAETVALLLPPPSQQDDRSLAAWVEDEIAPLAGLSSPEVQARLRAAWDRLDRDERFVFGKLLTGAFRVGAGSAGHRWRSGPRRAERCRTYRPRICRYAWEPGRWGKPSARHSSGCGTPH